MRNEALETHAVRRVRLLAAPRPPGGRVLAGTDDRLYPARRSCPPLECRAPEGDCRATLRAVDGIGPRLAGRRRGPRGARGGGAPLPRPRAAARGVAIAARQTLLSTFLFYQTMAYVGRGAGEFLAALERGGPEAGRRALGMARVLGGIDVEVAEGDGPWRAIGSFDEAGPIAGDLRVVPFEATGAGPLRVRLRLARGHWRLDAVALADLGEPVAPIRLEPASVERDGRRDDGARARLVDGERHLVTRPGDAYRLIFRLPPSDGRLDLFLESEGFYYEWMRSEWLAEEDPRMAALALADPAEALRRLAPAYKAEEPASSGRSGPAASESEVRACDFSRAPRARATLAALVAGGCAARTSDVFGRAVTLVPREAGARRRRASSWPSTRGGSGCARRTECVTSTPPPLREVRVRRHNLTGGWAVRWGLVGGLVSGVAMTAACCSVEGNDAGGCASGRSRAGEPLDARRVPGRAEPRRVLAALPRPAERPAEAYARLPAGPAEGCRPDRWTRDRPRRGEATLVASKPTATRTVTRPRRTVAPRYGSRAQPGGRPVRRNSSSRSARAFFARRSSSVSTNSLTFIWTGMPW